MTLEHGGGLSSTSRYSRYTTATIVIADVVASAMERTAISQQDRIVEHSFEWPECEAPHPNNFALASKLCTALILKDPTMENVITHFPSGWSSNDIIQISSHPQHFIVKLPRLQGNSDAATRCIDEAVRTGWAASHGFGPQALVVDTESGGFVMERLKGQTLTIEMIKQRLPQTVDLLRRIHGAEAADWMRKFDPTEIVKGQLDSVKAIYAMGAEEIRLVENIIYNAIKVVQGHPWVPCHNDFHSHNIFLQPSGRMMAIDFEDCDLGDPMWDLAYLIVNLELEGVSSEVEDLYGVTMRERRRVLAYIPLAMAHCATWAAIRGAPWIQHCREIMGRLKEFVQQYPGDPNNQP
ncbi:MAG: hypothetical protein Q9213_001222 [Squamulea squamosa]